MLLVRFNPAALAAAALASCLTPSVPVHAAVDNYPVKSINIENAPGVEYYETFTLNNLFGYEADPHAVHGIQTYDGGYVMCGKATESNGGGSDAFVVKVRVILALLLQRFYSLA